MCEECPPLSIIGPRPFASLSFDLRADRLVGVFAYLGREHRMSEAADRPRRQSPSSDGHSVPAGVDQARIRAAVREILLAVGEDPDREGLRETPDRVARMYAEMFSGLHKDPAAPLRKTFTEKYDEMVLVKDITFEGMCEHHLLPFVGKAHIGYLP